ncbi:MAG TPA: hypothetical protein EYP53_00365 [Candidatus Latescibacteria bacterium]|nr:hypothetical protein [Candidatus Latescibacterota bacterium]
MRRYGRRAPYATEFIIGILLLGTSAVQGEALSGPAPVTQVVAIDKPNDSGGSVLIRWKRSADDGAGMMSVKGYEILRSVEREKGYEHLTVVPAGVEEYVDNTTVDGTSYFYIIGATDGVHRTDSDPVGPVMSSAQWFHQGRLNMLIATVLLSGLVLWFINRAKKGKKLYIRPIAGLQAVDEAVGRATEMGRPVLYVPGIQDMDNIQTIAGIVILGRVAERTAQYGTPLIVPTSRSLVMTAAQETVKEAYLNVGRPDAYNPDLIRYLTDDQFGYAAGVDGMMVREKPAAIFYMGAFYAESLILAETGHSTGAIQIAGTAMPAQLPFFVTACDYTLIGEELFAASAYLSKEPLLLGSLKGQDWGKAIFIAILLLGSILASFGHYFLSDWLTTGSL